MTHAARTSAAFSKFQNTFEKFLKSPLTLQGKFIMPPKLLEIQLEDFDTIINHADLYAPGDDLVGMPIPLCWSVTTPSEARRRLEFHMTKQKERFLGDSTARFLKVVNDKSGEIMSIARWHWYPEGYSYTKGIHWETFNPIEGQTWPQEMNIEAHNHILRIRDAEREHWTEKGKPCWILMHLVTRMSQRGRGAAKMLVNWGIEKARRDGAPAYLEAGVLGVPLYARHGFQTIGELRVDLRPYGIESEIVMAKMGLFPGDRNLEDLR